MESAHYGKPACAARPRRFGSLLALFSLQRPQTGIQARLRQQCCMVPRSTIRPASITRIGGIDNGRKSVRDDPAMVRSRLAARISA